MARVKHHRAAEIIQVAAAKMELVGLYKVTGDSGYTLLGAIDAALWLMKSSYENGPEGTKAYQKNWAGWLAEDRLLLCGLVACETFGPVQNWGDYKGSKGLIGHGVRACEWARMKHVLVADVVKVMRKAVEAHRNV